MLTSEILVLSRPSIRVGIRPAHFFSCATGARLFSPCNPNDVGLIDAACSPRLAQPDFILFGTSTHLGEKSSPRRKFSMTEALESLLTFMSDNPKSWAISRCNVSKRPEMTVFMAGAVRISRLTNRGEHPVGHCGISSPSTRSSKGPCAAQVNSFRIAMAWFYLFWNGLINRFRPSGSCLGAN